MDMKPHREKRQESEPCTAQLQGAGLWVPLMDKTQGLEGLQPLEAVGAGRGRERYGQAWLPLKASTHPNCRHTAGMVPEAAAEQEAQGWLRPVAPESSEPEAGEPRHTVPGLR